ncbi:hypothetical protein HZA41_01680, partial [Candidatus Peregrinibacteria bacterium]|nr:hypothetical protein [Candidatus Peregrinibacteria bacterium]
MDDQKISNGFSSSSFFDQKKDDEEVFAAQPVAPDSSAKSFFENAAQNVQEGEVISLSQEVKGDASKEVHASEESQLVSEPTPAPFDDPSDNFFEKIKHTLTESGISMQTIRSYVIGCLIFIVVVFSLIFGGMKGYRFFLQKFSEIPAEEGVSQTEAPSEVSPEPLVVFPESLEFAILLGQEPGSFLHFPNPPLAIAYELGYFAERWQERFVQQVNFLREMRSTVKTDVFRLLDQSRNREEALGNYLAVLIKQENEGRKIASEISALIPLLEVRFTNAIEAKTLYETRFFESLKNLQGKESDEMLKGFIEMAQDAASAKGQFHALSKLKAHYETVLKWIST